MKIPNQFVRKLIIVAIAIAVVFAIYCIVSPPERVQWTGFKRDIETSRSRKIVRNGAEITTTTKDISGKTLWDWMTVLVVPLSLAFLGFWLQQQQQKQSDEQAELERKRINEQAKLENEIAENNQKEEVLQAYFDRLSALLVDKNLIATATKLRRTAEAGEEQSEVVVSDHDISMEEQKELLDAAVDVIRARTLSILRRLGEDGERKSSVILFLFEAKIISQLKLDLSGANLSGAYLYNMSLSNINLSFANLRDTHLSNANLGRAMLFGTDLSSAILANAILSGANLSRADLSNATLRDADLSSTYLRDAVLSNANLSNAILRDADLSNADLSGANLCGAVLSKANFSNANFSGADLSNTYFDGACLSNADLASSENWSDTNFQSAKLCKTKLPPESILDPDRDCK